jgi:hypothetical protein
VRMRLTLFIGAEIREWEGESYLKTLSSSRVIKSVVDERNVSMALWWNHWTGKVGGLGREAIPLPFIFHKPHKCRPRQNHGLRSKRSATNYLVFFIFGATTPSGPGPPHSRGL